MPVQEIYVYKTGREGAKGQAGRVLYSTHLIALTTDANTEQAEILSHADCPQPYTPYRTDTIYDPRAVVRSVKASQRSNSTTTWDVIVEYDSEFEKRENPFSEPVDIRLDTELYEESLYMRQESGYVPGEGNVFIPSAGVPTPIPEVIPNPRSTAEATAKTRADFCTSAGEPFDPPIKIQKSRPLVIFTRNEPLMTVIFKVTYENTINKKKWCGLEPRMAWLRSIKATTHVQKAVNISDKDIYYLRVEYTFALNAETWDMKIPDVGSYYLDYASGSAVRRSFVVEGTNHPRLGRLDHSVAAQPGKKLAAGTDVQFLQFGDAAFRTTDFSNLNINLNLALTEQRARRRGRNAA